MPVNIGMQAVAIYVALVLAIPIQLYLSIQDSVPASQRQANFRSLISSVSDFHHNYLSLSTWRHRCFKVWSYVQGLASRKPVWYPDYDEGECPAYEVFKFQSPEGFFGFSTIVRSPRPPTVKFRVGQVVQHKVEGFRGVIVAWDPVARAPETWLDYWYPANKPQWRVMPNYAVLADVRDEPTLYVKYVPQENLEVITHYEVLHPAVQAYFDSFDGAQYIMRPALKHLYPHD